MAKHEENAAGSENVANENDGVATPAYDFSKAKSLDRPRDMAWKNWARFPNVGDKVEGFIVDVFFRPAQAQFKDARGITLKQADGKLINVSIKHLPWILKKTDNLRLGDPLVVVYSEALPAPQKGYSQIKQFEFKGENLPQNAGNKTVRELEEEDMALGGTSAQFEEDVHESGKPENEDIDPDAVPF